MAEGYFSLVNVALFLTWMMTCFPGSFKIIDASVIVKLSKKYSPGSMYILTSPEILRFFIRLYLLPWESVTEPL